MFSRSSQRWSVAVIGSGLVAMSLLAGCSSDADPRPRPTPSTTAPTTPTAVELRLAVYGDDATVSTYRRIAAAYTAAHPEVTFELTSTSDASAGAESALGAIATGTNPPDVFLLDVDHLPAVVEADAVQPVNELLEARGIPFGDGIQRTGLTAFSANNVLACMPNDVSPLVMFYNTRLVKPQRLQLEDDSVVGPIDQGWTWEAFLAAADQAVRRGASEGARGTYLPFDLATLSPFLLSAGGNVVDDERAPTRLGLSDGGTRDALKQLAVLTRDRQLTLSPSQVEATSALTWFMQGRLGLLVGTRALVPTLREASDLSFDVAPLPRLDSTVTTSTMNAYCIAKTSEHIDAAADFIAYAVDGDGARIAADSGAMVPSSLDVLNSEEFLQPGLQPRSSRVFGEGARRSVPTPYSTHWLSAAASVTEVLKQVLYGRGLDVTSESTPALDELLSLADEASQAIFSPPEPTETPTP